MQTLDRPVVASQPTIQELSKLPTRKVPLQYLAAVMEYRENHYAERYAKFVRTTH